MKNSPIYPNYEATDYRFDPQIGFSEFLEEAKQHASEVNSQQASLKHQEGDIGKRRLGGEEKKGKKSWKSKVLSWLKSDKKSNAFNNHKNSKEGSGSGAIGSNPRRVHVSGPIYGSGRKLEIKYQRPTSGPLSLTTLFNPNKRVESHVPYMCLDNNLNNSPQSQHGVVKAYGPVYLVT